MPAPKCVHLDCHHVGDCVAADVVVVQDFFSSPLAQNASHDSPVVRLDLLVVPVLFPEETQQIGDVVVVGEPALELLLDPLVELENLGFLVGVGGGEVLQIYSHQEFGDIGVLLETPFNFSVPKNVLMMLADIGRKIAPLIL